MQFRSVPPVPVVTDRPAEQRAIGRVRPGHHEPLKPGDFAGMGHRATHSGRSRAARLVGS